MWREGLVWLIGVVVCLLDASQVKLFAGVAQWMAA